MSRLIVPSAFFEGMPIAPPSPCEVYKCPSRIRCREDQVACDAWEHYARTGRAVSPLTQLNGLRRPKPELAPSIVVDRNRLEAA